MFSTLKGFKYVKSVKPKIGRDDLVEDLYDLLQQVQHNPIILAKRIAQLVDEKSKTYDFINYPSSSMKSRNRSKIFTYERHKYSLDNIEESSPDIYHNIYPYSLRDFLEEGEISLFTYLIDSDGLHIARYNNVFEFGTGHMYLTDFLKEDPYIIAAGELLIQDNTLFFNLQSGSYMKEMNLNETPRYKAFLIDAVKDILSYSPFVPFDSVDYVEEVLFPFIFPQRWELEKDLARAGNKVIVDEKENLADLIRYRTVEEAQEYFSRYPYERVNILQDGIVYTNPYRDRPSTFINIKLLYPDPIGYTGRKNRY